MWPTASQGESVDDRRETPFPGFVVRPVVGNGRRDVHVGVAVRRGRVVREPVVTDRTSAVGEPVHPVEHAVVAAVVVGHRGVRHGDGRAVPAVTRETRPRDRPAQQGDGRHRPRRLGVGEHSERLTGDTRTQRVGDDVDWSVGVREPRGQRRAVAVGDRLRDPPLPVRVPTVDDRRERSRRLVEPDRRRVCLVAGGGVVRLEPVDEQHRRRRRELTLDPGCRVVAVELWCAVVGERVPGRHCGERRRCGVVPVTALELREDVQCAGAAGRDDAATDCEQAAAGECPATRVCVVGVCHEPRQQPVSGVADGSRTTGQPSSAGRQPTSRSPSGGETTLNPSDS